MVYPAATKPYIRFIYLAAANGYKIEQEVLAEEGTQLYEILYVTHGHMDPFSEIEAEIGVTESRYKDKLFVKHLKKLINQRK